MSGDLQRKQYHKQKNKNKNSFESQTLDKVVPNAALKRSKAGKSKNTKPPTTSLFVKLLFFLSLSALALVATLTFTDYQNGQLWEAYEAHVPPQVVSNKKPATKMLNGLEHTSKASCSLIYIQKGFKNIYQLRLHFKYLFSVLDS